MNTAALQIHLDNLYFANFLNLRSPAHFCWFENTIQFKSTDHTLEVHTVFMVLKAHQLKKGLTSDEWDYLTDIIFKFLKEKKSCQK